MGGATCPALFLCFMLTYAILFDKTRQFKNFRFLNESTKLSQAFALRIFFLPSLYIFTNTHATLPVYSHKCVSNSHKVGRRFPILRPTTLSLHQQEIDNLMLRRAFGPSYTQLSKDSTQLYPLILRSSFDNAKRNHSSIPVYCGLLFC